MMTKDTKPVSEEPKTFTKAWNHPKANSSMKWQEAIKKEFAWHEKATGMAQDKQKSCAS